jgi:hypothetical protein
VIKQQQQGQQRRAASNGARAARAKPATLRIVLADTRHGEDLPQRIKALLKFAGRRMGMRCCEMSLDNGPTPESNGTARASSAREPTSASDVISTRQNERGAG